MKKLIFSLAILAASSMAVMAQTSTPCNPGSNCLPAGTCAVSNECRNGADGCNPAVCPAGEKNPGCRKYRDCGMADSAKRVCREDILFQDLNLSKEQQTKLSDLRKSLREKCRKAADERKCDRDGKKCQSAEQKKQMKEAAKGRVEAARKDYLAGVKSILTAEQYTKFLENNYVYMQGGKHFVKGKHKGNKDGVKGGRRGDRPERKGGKK